VALAFCEGEGGGGSDRHSGEVAACGPIDVTDSDAHAAGGQIVRLLCREPVPPLGVRGDKIPPPVGEVYEDLAGEGTEVSVTPPLRRARHVAGIACMRVATKREPYGAVGDRYRISLRDARFAARAVERDGEVLIRAEGVWAERECFELEGRAVGTCGDGGAWKHAQKVPRRRHQRVALAHEVRGVVVLCEAGGAGGP